MVTLVFVYTAMHCECMPWYLLNIKALGSGTEFLLEVFRGWNSNKIVLFISYFLATVIPIFLFSKGHLSLDTLQGLVS